MPFSKAPQSINTESRKPFQNHFLEWKRARTHVAHLQLSISDHRCSFILCSCSAIVIETRIIARWNGIFLMTLLFKPKPLRKQ